jgi:hypothetical protein
MHVVVLCKELNLEKLSIQSCRVLLRHILFVTSFVFPCWYVKSDELLYPVLEWMRSHKLWRI